MPVVAKKWYQSKTVVVDVITTVIFAAGLIAESVGSLQLDPRVAIGAGIVVAVANFVLRLVTNTAIDGTPAASDAPLAPPMPENVPKAAADFAKQIEQMKQQRDSLNALLASVAAQASTPPPAG